MSEDRMLEIGLGNGNVAKDLFEEAQAVNQWILSAGQKRQVDKMVVCNCGNEIRVFITGLKEIKCFRCRSYVPLGHKAQVIGMVRSWIRKHKFAEELSASELEVANGILEETGDDDIGIVRAVL